VSVEREPDLEARLATHNADDHRIADEGRA
jgi:hypothetical protein